MGQVLAGGGSRPITAEELQSVAAMQQAMTQIPVPTLQHRDNPHEYLFFAMSDGSGQDHRKPELGLPTNVAKLYQQAETLENNPSNRIGAHYTAGIGSQDSAFARLKDGALATTWADGIEEMYTEFTKQSWMWKQQDPDAKIRIASLGYSRGAVQVAGFLRLVDQFGILNPEDLKFGRDEHGNIMVKSPYPPLVSPEQVAQVAVLLDPVATHFPRNYDARLTPRAISSVSLLAATEARKLFPHQTINDPGITPDGRAMTAPMPGGHSNVGGGNKDSGLEIFAGNAVTDYLNLLTDRPLFEKRPLPADLSTITVYQARGATAPLGLAMDNDGQRNLREKLANCKIVDPCKDSEPIDRALAAQFEYRHVQLDPREQAQLQALIVMASDREQSARIGGRQDEEQQASRDAVSQLTHPHLKPGSELDRLFDNAIGAYLGNDDRALTRVMDEFRRSPDGQAWAQEQQQYSQAMREQERQTEQQRQAELAEQQRAQEQASRQRGPVLSLFTPPHHQHPF